MKNLILVAALLLGNYAFAEDHMAAPAEKVDCKDAKNKDVKECKDAAAASAAHAGKKAKKH